MTGAMIATVPEEPNSVKSVINTYLRVNMLNAFSVIKGFVRVAHMLVIIVARNTQALVIKRVLG